MRSKTSTWFEAVVRYEKTQEDGTKKNVTETYAIDALTCTEAENKLLEEMKPFISGNYNVKSVKEAPYKEIFFSDMDKDGKWFKVKLSFITIDEKTEKERRSAVVYLVQGSALLNAVKNLIGEFDGTTTDYEVSSAQETKILDVYEHK